jgi:FR47-like protein
MEFQDFVTLHEPGLRDEVRHGVMLDIIRNADHHGRDIKWWSCGDRPGQCAVKVSCVRAFENAPEEAHWSIMLGDLDEQQCRLLAAATLHEPYPSIMGIGLTAQWFAMAASELGVSFSDIEPQGIYRLTEPAVAPPIPGYARAVGPDDAEMFKVWLPAFSVESSPHDPLPTPADAESIIGERRYYLWIDNERPVSMAGMCRRLDATTAVTGVFTPPPFRGRGYAAAITAHVSNIILADEGRDATLYVDLRATGAVRCYNRLGFKSAYTSLQFHR